MCDLKLNMTHGEELIAGNKNDEYVQDVFWDLNYYSESESSEDEDFNILVEHSKKARPVTKIKEQKKVNEEHKICKYCDKSIEINKFKSHMKRHKHYVEYYCKLCPKVFKNKASLYAHRESHQPTKRYVCDKCGSCFVTWSCLYNHSILHNTKLYNCHHCSKSFHKKYDFNMHLRTHTGERPHVCFDCFAAFRTPGQLKRHVKTIHDQITNHECQTCGERFHHAYMLKQHEDTHTGSRDNVCSVCNKGFRTKNQLFRHSRSHTGAKPFKCNVCDMCFSDASNRKRHMLTHGKDKVAKYFKKPIAKRKNKRTKASNDSSNLEIQNPINDNFSLELVKLENCDDTNTKHEECDVTIKLIASETRAATNKTTILGNIFKEDNISGDNSRDNVSFNDIDLNIETNNKYIAKQQFSTYIKENEYNSPKAVSNAVENNHSNIEAVKFVECNIDGQDRYDDVTDKLTATCELPIDPGDELINRFSLAEYFNETEIDKILEVPTIYPVEYACNENNECVNDVVECNSGTTNETIANSNNINTCINDYAGTTNINSSLSDYLIIRDNMTTTNNGTYVNHNIFESNSFEELPLFLLDSDLPEAVNDVYENETNTNVLAKSESLLKMLENQGTVMIWDDKALNFVNINQEVPQNINTDAQPRLSEELLNNDLLQFAHILSNDSITDNNSVTENILPSSHNNVQIDTNNFNSLSTYLSINDKKMEYDHLQKVENKNLLFNINSYCVSDLSGSQGTYNLNDSKSNLNIPNKINGVIFKMPETLSITKENLVYNKNIVFNNVSPAVTITREYNV